MAADGNKKWVLWSSDTSIEQGQYSLLALLEVVLAVGAYWYIARYTGWPWMMWIGLFAAPILLMRSEQSVALGLRFLKPYIDRQEKDIGRIEYFALISIVIVATSFMSFYLTKSWLPTSISWSLIWRAATIGYIGLVLIIMLASMLGLAVSVEGAGAISGAGPRALAVAVSITLSLLRRYILPIAVLGGLISMFTVAASGLGVAIIAGFGTFVGAGAVIVVLAISDRVVAFLFIIPFFVGLLFRITFIRFFSSLRHPILGLHQLPTNWRTTLLKIDLMHPPEMMPGAGVVLDILTMRGLMLAVRTDKSFFRRILFAIAIPICYLPAIAYRWSLKSTAWFWWPLAWALQPPLYGLDFQTTRERAARIVAWHIPVIFVMFAVVAWAWLPVFSGVKHLIEDLPKFAQFFINNLPPIPDKCARFVLANVAFACAIITTYYCVNLKATHGKVLESPNEAEGLVKIDEQTKVPGKKGDQVENFKRLARTVDFLRLPLIASIFFFGEAWVLVTANSKFPQFFKALHLDWLIAYL